MLSIESYPIHCLFSSSLFVCFFFSPVLSLPFQFALVLSQKFSQASTQRLALTHFLVALDEMIRAELVTDDSEVQSLDCSSWCSSPAGQGNSQISIRTSGCLQATKIVLSAMFSSHVDGYHF